MSEATLEFEEEARRPRLDDEVLQFEVRLHVSTRGELGPELIQEQRHLRAGDAHRLLKDFAQRPRQTERAQGAFAPHPLVAQQQRWSDARLEGEPDLAAAFERRLQRERQGRFVDADRAGFSQRHARMPRQHREQRRELLRLQHDHRGRLAAGQSFELIDQRRVARIEGERTLPGQRVQWRASTGPLRFEHEHDLPAWSGLLEVRRKNHEQLRRQAVVGAAQRGRFQRRGLGRFSRPKRSVACAGLGRHCGLQASQQMQSDRDGVRADLPPLARLAAGADVLDVDGTLDDESGAEGGLARRHDTAQERRRPVGAEDMILLQVGAGALHRLPASGFGEQRFSQLDGHHGHPDAKQRRGQMPAQARACHPSRAL